MNNMIKRIIALFLALTLGSLAWVNVLAEEQTSQIFDLEKNTHMMITVEYTNGVPIVKFIAPNGTEYGAEAIAQGLMRMEDDGSSLTYWIPNAQAGQWEMVYDKGANPKLNVAWVPYAEIISINQFDFSVNPDRSDRLNVTLGASYVSNSWYDYVIYAAITDSNGNIEGTRELASGRLRANSAPYDLNVNIGSLSTYDSYKLLAEVSVTTGSFTVTDSKISENTFSYVNDNAPEAMENVYVEVNTDDESLKLDWSDYKVYCEKYMVAVYVDDNSEAYYFNEFDSGITSTELLIDPNVSKLKIQIGYEKRYSDSVSRLLTKEIDMAMAKAVSIESKDASADSVVKIDYDFSAFSDKVKTIIAVNDNKQEALLSDKGTMSAKLDLFDNEVYAYWYLDDTTVFVSHKSVYYDNIAPTLVLPEITSTVKTDKSSYILVGYTDSGCVVTVNGVQAETDESGSFKITIDLNEGENTISVIAKNGLGNSSAQSFSVIRAVTGVVEDITPDGSDDAQNDSGFAAFLKSYLPLVLTLLAGIILIIFVFVCRKLGVKRKAQKGTASAVLWTIGMVFTYLAVVAGGYMGLCIYNFVASSRILNSMEFYESANLSISKSYELIQNHELYEERLIISACVFGGLTLLAVLMLVLSRVFSKKKGSPEEKIDEPQTPVVELQPEIDYISGMFEKPSTEEAPTETASEEAIQGSVEDVQSEDNPEA